MSKSVGASAPDTYTLTFAQYDAMKESHLRLTDASSALEAMCNLLAGNDGQITIDPQGLYLLLHPVEIEVSIALDALKCAVEEEGKA